MAVLREVYVWPPSGFRDRPWREDADADAFAKVARAVCDRYCEALPELGITHWTSQLRIFAWEPADAHVPADQDGPWWEFLSGGPRTGFEAAEAVMPAGVAGGGLARQQQAVLDVVHAATVEMATQRGLVNAERLVEARDHVISHDYGYAWTSPWRRAPRGPASGARNAGRLAARVYFQLEPDGFGTARIEVAALDPAGTPRGPEAAASSDTYPTWTTAPSFRRAVKTGAWLGPDHFTIRPYVDLIAQGDSVHLLVTGTGAPEDPLHLTEWTDSDRARPTW